MFIFTRHCLKGGYCFWCIYKQEFGFCSRVASSIQCRQYRRWSCVIGEVFEGGGGTLDTHPTLPRWLVWSVRPLFSRSSSFLPFFCNPYAPLRPFVVFIQWLKALYSDSYILRLLQYRSQMSSAPGVKPSFSVRFDYIRFYWSCVFPIAKGPGDPSVGQRLGKSRKRGRSDGKGQGWGWWVTTPSYRAVLFYWSMTITPLCWSNFADEYL